MTPARELTGAIGGCVLGAAVVLLASGRPWAAGEISRGDGVPVADVSMSGHELAPATTGLAVLALAAVAALVATRGVVRRGVGALVLVAAAGLVLDAVLAGARADVTAAADAPDATRIDLALAPWPWVAVAGALVVAAAGLLIVVRGASWPTMSRRYDVATREPATGSPADSTDDTGRRAVDNAEGPPAHPGAVETASRSPEELWRALDRGEDPTR